MGAHMRCILPDCSIRTCDASPCPVGPSHAGAWREPPWGAAWRASFLASPTGHDAAVAQTRSSLPCALLQGRRTQRNTLHANTLASPRPRLKQQTAASRIIATASTMGLAPAGAAAHTEGDAPYAQPVLRVLGSLAHLHCAHRSSGRRLGIRRLKTWCDPTMLRRPRCPPSLPDQRRAPTRGHQ